MNGPQGAQCSHHRERGAAGSGDEARDLSRPVAYHGKERQSAVTGPLERGEARGQRLEFDRKAGLQYGVIVTRLLACPQKPAIRKKKRRRGVIAHVVGKHRADGGIVAVDGVGKGRDDAMKFKLDQLPRQLKLPLLQTQHLRQLDLPSMIVEPPVALPDHVQRQDTQGELVSVAQPVHDPALHVGAGQANLVGKLLCRGVEIGKMVLPLLDRRPVRRKAVGGGTGIWRFVEQSRKRRRRARGGGKEFLRLLSVDGEIGQARVGKAAHEAVHAADRGIVFQSAGVELETIDEADDDLSAQRTPIPLDQVEVARGDRKPRGHRGLGQPFPAAKAADSRASIQRIGHNM